MRAFSPSHCQEPREDLEPDFDSFLLSSFGDPLPSFLPTPDFTPLFETLDFRFAFSSFLSFASAPDVLAEDVDEAELLEPRGVSGRTGTPEDERTGPPRGEPGAPESEPARRPERAGTALEVEREREEDD